MSRAVSIRAETVGTSVAPIFDAPFPAQIAAGQTVATLIASLDAPTISEVGVPAIDGGDLTSTITVGGDSVSGDYELLDDDVVRRVVSTVHATGVVVEQSPVVTTDPVVVVPTVDLDLSSLTQPDIRIPASDVPPGYVPAASGGVGDLAWTTSKPDQDWRLVFDDWQTARAAIHAQEITHILVPTSAE